MHSGGVLVFGCSGGLANSGLKADEKAILAQEIPVIAVSTGSTTENGKSDIEIIEPEASILKNETENAIHKMDFNVVKIGALSSEESIKIVSSSLQQNAHLMSVIDVEPFFKIGPAPKAEVITALRTDILPFISVLSATVPEVKALLDESGILIDYPRSIQDVLSMANSLRSLGPKYVIIKREIFEESDGTTTLHFVLCGGEEPLIVTSRCENPKRVFEASYSIPPVIAAYLAKGHSVPEAVSAGVKFVEEMLKGGRYFD